MKSSVCLLLMIGLGMSVSTVQAQLEFEGPPINYLQAAADNPISRLQQELESGQIELEYKEQQGYLPALLKALKISPESQVLVFSKTSFQLRKISPERPRALYFNDDTYVGWVQRGDVIEISTVDPLLGAVFYTLQTGQRETLQFVRDKGQCLTCHASSRTRGVPGHLVRSVFPDQDGQPLLASGTFNTDHTSPFSERWGGWYVSGSHGQMRHMGNISISDESAPEDLDREAGANLQDLNSVVDTAPYLSSQSDLVALMVLEHQAQMHNAITRAHLETRLALHYDKIMNEALDRDPEYRSESTDRRIQSASEKLVQYLLFCDEYQLESAVSGNTGYAAYFESLGPFDAQGRSLRQFNLQTRMFEYPCSYLIYSEAFQSLPEPVLNYVQLRLREILTAATPPEGFEHLTYDTRAQILSILQQTLPGYLADVP